MFEFTIFQDAKLEEKMTKQCTSMDKRLDSPSELCFKVKIISIGSEGLKGTGLCAYFIKTNFHSGRTPTSINFFEINHQEGVL